VATQLAQLPAAGRVPDLGPVGTAVTMRLPSGLNATDRTEAVSPFSSRSSLPLARVPESGPVCTGGDDGCHHRR